MLPLLIKTYLVSTSCTVQHCISGILPQHIKSARSHKYFTDSYCDFLLSIRLAPYRGWFPVISSLCCSNFVYFYTFNSLKALWVKGQHSTTGKDLVLGVVAGNTYKSPFCQECIFGIFYLMIFSMKSSGGHAECSYLALYADLLLSDCSSVSSLPPKEMYKPFHVVNSGTKCSALVA